MNLGMLGALGGMGKGLADVGQEMTRSIDQDERDRKHQAIEEWRMAKQEEYAIGREKRAVEAKRAEELNDAKTRIAADEKGASNLQDAEFQKFKRDLGQTDATDDQLRQVFQQQYFDKSVAPGDANTDRFNPRDSAFIKSSQDAALKMGASGGLLKQYTQDLKDQRGVERQQDVDAFNARKQSETERANRVREDQRDTQNDLQARRIEAMFAKVGASGGKDGAKEVLSFIDNSRKELSANEANLRNIMADEIKEEPSPEKKQTIRDKYQPQLDAVSEKRTQLESDFNAVREKVGLPAVQKKPDLSKNKPKPVVNALPTGAKQIGTSGGKPVYQTPDGKKFIAQ